MAGEWRWRLGVRIEERPVHHGRDGLEGHVVDGLPDEFTQVVEAVEHGQGGECQRRRDPSCGPSSRCPICLARALDMTMNVLRITSSELGIDCGEVGPGPEEGCVAQSTAPSRPWSTCARPPIGAAPPSAGKVLMAS